MKKICLAVAMILALILSGCASELSSISSAKLLDNPLTEAEARANLQAWLANHPFTIPVTIGTDLTDEDETGFVFTLYQDTELARIRIVKNTGVMLRYNPDANAYNAIDDWYKHADGSANNSVSSTPTTTNAPANVETSTPIQDYYAIGDTVSDDGLELTLVSAYTQYDDFWGHTDLVFHFEVRNTSSTDKSISAGSFELSNADDRMMDSCDYGSDLSAKVKPNRTTSGDVAFIIREDSVYFDLYFEAGWLSDDIIFRVFKN
jgi:uncharacterized protein YceK